MIDAAHAYEETVVVGDPDEPQPSIAIGRAPSEDLTMQVRLEDGWHRKLVDVDETACEKPFRIAGVHTRREQLTHSNGPLCTVCFTPRELRRATENDARSAEEAERRRMREDIDARFRSLPRVRRPSEGEE
jgi:hypothetical protein